MRIQKTGQPAACPLDLDIGSSCTDLKSRPQENVLVASQTELQMLMIRGNPVARGYMGGHLIRNKPLRAFIGIMGGEEHDDAAKRRRRRLYY